MNGNKKGERRREGRVVERVEEVQASVQAGGRDFRGLGDQRRRLDARDRDANLDVR